MKNLPLLLSWRYLMYSHHQQSIHVMVRLCFIGVFIGTFCLALVLSIMHGFEYVTHEKFRGVHAPITIRSYEHPLDIDALVTVFKNEFPEIASYSPTNTQHVIIESASTDNAFTVIAMKGVQPELEVGMNTLAKSFIPTATNKNFRQALEGNQILIGKKLAQELQVAVGDAITLLYARPEQTRKNQLALDSTQALIGGLFTTGIDEFDTSIAICSLNFLHNLFPDAQPTQMSVSLHPGYNEQDTIHRLTNRLGLDVFSWQDLYPALVSALKLEKYGMFLILILITLVASMNIISLLFMQITHKRNDVAILKAMGMSNTQVKHIFILMGASISFLGSLMGLIAAFFAGLLLDRYPLIELPDAYYVSHLPIHMTWEIFCSIFIIALLLGFIASLVPLSRINSITIARMLRI